MGAHRAHAFGGGRGLVNRNIDVSSGRDRHFECAAYEDRNVVDRNVHRQANGYDGRMRVRRCADWSARTITRSGTYRSGVVGLMYSPIMPLRSDHP